MAIIQIPNLPAVIGIDGSELFEGVQAGTSVKISAAQIIAAAQIGTPLSLPLAVSIGGTGLTTFAVGDIMYASATQTLSKLADVALGNAIISGGVGAAPSYGKIGLTTHISGVLPVANGGTNIASYAVGDILYASAAGVLSPLADVALGNVILSGGIGAAPAYGKVDLTTHISGVLPVANGGTNQSAALTQYGVIYGSTTTAMASSAAGTSTQVLHGNAAGAPTFGAVSLTADVSGTLPVANGGTGVTTSTGTGAVVLGTGPTITSGVYSGTVGATGATTGAFTSLTASTSVLSSGTGGVGYATGAGVAVTQLVSRTTSAPTTGVSKSGAITVFTAAAVVGTYFSFTVPNTGIDITDTVVLTIRGGSNTYVANCSLIIASTSFRVTMVSVAGTASDTPIVNFTIIKGVSA
jgi:hypothetical protein